MIRIFRLAIVLFMFASRAFAAETTTIRLQGTFDSRTAIATPPVSPVNFGELAISSFFTLSVLVSDSASRSRTLEFYFWHSSQESISARVYVDAALTGGASGTPVLVGSGELTFANDGTKMSSGNRPDLHVSAAWVEHSTSEIAVHFTPVTLSGSSSSLMTEVQNSILGTQTDFDGDGIDDFVVFRPEFGIWAVRLSSVPGSSIVRQWGLPGDYPIAGDYTGDGIADLVVYRLTDGNWFICKSESNFDCFSSRGNIVSQFGLRGDKPVRADYDHDGILDLAVWRPSNGQFIYRSSRTGQMVITQWGLRSDIPLHTVPNK